MMIIDSPVNAFSPIDKIQDWLGKLETYPQEDSAVKSAIAEAKGYLDPDRFVNYAKERLSELATYPQDDPDIQEEIADAKRDLVFARSIEAKLNQEPERQAA